MTAPDGKQPGWVTALITTAHTQGGQRTQVVVGIVETDDGLETALRVGEHGDTAILRGDTDAQLISRLRYAVLEKLHRRGDL